MNSSDALLQPDGKILSDRFKLILFIVLIIPSILVSVFIFVHLFCHPNVMRSRQNHGLILLLTVNLIKLTTSMPLTMDFYRRERIFSTTPTTCTWLNFYEFSICAIILLLVTTVSIQRHLFIFNSQLMNNRRARLIVHTLPLVACCLYPPLFYLFVVVLDPCNYVEAPWDYNSILCGFTVCYSLFNKFLALFDFIGNNGLPMLMIVFINITLIVRVIRQKQRLHVAADWRKHRRMVLQMASISMLHLLSWSPLLSIATIQALWSPMFAAKLYREVLVDMVFLDCLLLPYLYINLVPNIFKKPWIRWPTRLHTSTAAAAAT
jgi:hypothetical protein